MIKELAKMCFDLNFDKEKALELIKQVDVNQEYLDAQYSWPKILIIEAVENFNVEMLRLLLENGADPNKVVDTECALWDLQYSCRDEGKSEVNLLMAHLLLEYGADPVICPDPMDEDLFSWVWWEVCEKDDPLEEWIHRCRFFLLLVAYGGKKDWIIPKILDNFDRTKARSYTFEFLPEKFENYYDAVIRDENQNVVAYV